MFTGIDLLGMVKVKYLNLAISKLVLIILIKILNADKRTKDMKH